jgi:hypothetical protein
MRACVFVFSGLTRRNFNATFLYPLATSSYVARDSTTMQRMPHSPHDILTQLSISIYWNPIFFNSITAHFTPFHILEQIE